MLATLPIAGTLPASKTHRERRWTFLPFRDATKPGLGVVTLVQGTRDLDSYGIDVVDGQVLFAKLDSEADVYAVHLNRDGKPVHCTCKGFGFKRTCKHLDATRELIADGIIG